MVLTVLTILAILAIVFASLTRVERTVSHNYVDAVRARFLAQSGIEMALTYLPDLESTEQGLSPAIYGLEFTDQNKNGRFDPAVDVVVKITSSTPLDETRFPSLKGWGNQADATAELTVEDINRDGKPDQIGYTAALPSFYPGGVDTYTLRIQDCASMIYVNGPSVSASDWSLAPNVVMMLNNLGNLPAVKISGLGNILSNARAGLKRNFVSKEELKQALLKAGRTENDYNRVKNYLTCYAWVDQKTLLPGALQPINTSNIRYKWSYNDHPGFPLTGFLHHGSRGYFSLKIPFLPCCSEDLINTQYHPGGVLKFENRDITTPAINFSDSVTTPAVFPREGISVLLQPRAPVNINTAPQEILQAVLTGVQGYALDRNGKNYDRPGNRFWNSRSLISSSMAARLANAIIAARQTKPFLSWNDFNTFIDSLTWLQDPYQKMVVKANANPNSHLSKFNPNKIFGLRYGDTDKSDLGDWVPPLSGYGGTGRCGWTTEFCFSSMGYYEIESLGQVWSPVTKKGGRKPLARRQINTIVKIYDVLRHTTQKDFFNQPQAAGYDPESSGFTTFPESLRDLSTSSLWTNISSNCLSQNEDLCQHQLCYDGYITLTPRDDPFDWDTGSISFAADYNNTLGAQRGGGDQKAYGRADEDRLLIDPGDPSELFPDGVFCHETTWNQQLSEDEFLRYNSAGNFNVAGSLEMWIKPTWNGNEVNAFGYDSRVLFSFGPGEKHRPIAWQEDWWANPDAEKVVNRIILFVRNSKLCAFLASARAISFDQTIFPSYEIYSNYLNLDLPPGMDSRYPYYVPAMWHSFYNDYAVVEYPVTQWQAGEWHHVALSWQPTELRLFVDGKEANGSPLITGNRPFKNGLGSDWSLFVGNNRFEEKTTNGYPMPADCTIDNLKIYNKPIAAAVVPMDRYEDVKQIFTGTFSLDKDYRLSLSGSRLGHIYWTSYNPGNRTGGLTVQVMSGNQTFDVPDGTDGKGYAVNQPVPTGTNALGYKIRFIPPAPNLKGIIDETPILDDVTLTLLGTPKFISYFME